jgi:predicted outer membrane protein
MRVSISLFVAAVVWTAPALSQQRITSEDFAKKVAISDRMEIESSQLALSRAPDSDTKPLAEKMVKDHQQTSAEVKSLVDSGKLKATLRTALDTVLAPRSCSLSGAGALFRQSRTGAIPTKTDFLT